MPDKANIPQLARRCWEAYCSATQHLREASEESLKFWLGGDHQWRPGELNSRIANNRPYVTMNRCKPAVDQVENEARNNPPGPKVRPEGGGADTDGADILSGLIREYEYRSDAPRAYITGLRYAAAGNYGVFELATEYAGQRTLQQRLVVKEAEDPAMYFVDPDARMACREDAMWAGKIRVYSREKLIAEYGNKLKVLNRNYIDGVTGWMQQAVGWRGEQATVNQWTGGGRSEGPYYVCEFYRVTIERKRLRLYSDSVLRYDDENIPKGVTPVDDEERWEPVRTVTKHLVTALDEISEPVEWLGDIIPYFWIMGPEIYISGKLYRLSLIDGAKDSQRGLNYTATSAVEIVNGMTKAPWVGWVGQFDVANAQGMNPWESSNTQMWAYMEVKPVFAHDEPSGTTTLLPPPQRNTWEAPIARLLELATFFIEGIKGATSVFFDPSIQSVRDAQSGEAIRALQSQTNIGTLNWQDQLHRAVTLSYRQSIKILPKIMDGPRVATLIRADSQHELMEINQDFPGGVHPVTGKKVKENNITRGYYTAVATAGPSFEDRTDKAIEALTEVFKIAPMLLSQPGIAAQFLRMVGEGSPQVEQIADQLMGKVNGENTPEELQRQLMQLQQSDQAKTELLQRMQQALAAKLPEVDAKKWMAALDAVTRIRVAEINASKDRDNAKADNEGALLDSMLNMAHDAGLQAQDQEHQVGLQSADQQHQAVMAQQAQQAAQQQPPQQEQQAA